MSSVSTEKLGVTSLHEGCYPRFLNEFGARLEQLYRRRFGHLSYDVKISLEESGAGAYLEQAESLWGACASLTADLRILVTSEVYGDEQSFSIPEFPSQTTFSTFIINGNEWAPVTQLVPSPGFFRESLASDKKSKSDDQSWIQVCALIRPEKGPTIRFSNKRIGFKDANKKAREYISCTVESAYGQEIEINAGALLRACENELDGAQVQGLTLLGRFANGCESAYNDYRGGYPQLSRLWQLHGWLSQKEKDAIQKNGERFGKAIREQGVPRKAKLLERRAAEYEAMADWCKNVRLGELGRWQLNRRLGYLSGGNTPPDNERLTPEDIVKVLQYIAQWASCPASLQPDDRADLANKQVLLLDSLLLREFEPLFTRIKNDLQQRRGIVSFPDWIASIVELHGERIRDTIRSFATDARNCLLIDDPNPFLKLSMLRRVVVRDPEVSAYSESGRLQHWSHYGRVCCVDTPSQGDNAGLLLSVIPGCRVSHGILECSYQRALPAADGGDSFDLHSEYFWLSSACETADSPDGKPAWVACDPRSEHSEQHRVSAKRGAITSCQNAGEIDYWPAGGRPTPIIGSLPRLVPFLNRSDATRIIAACGMMRQVLPLKNAKPARVYTSDEETLRPFCNALWLGKLGSDCEQQPAYGADLLTGFMPWKAYTFEDGLVISQSAADTLTSFRDVRFKVDLCCYAYIEDGVIKESRDEMVTPNEEQPQLDNGLVRERENVVAGQVLVWVESADGASDGDMLGGQPPPEASFDRFGKSIRMPDEYQGQVLRVNEVSEDLPEGVWKRVVVVVRCEEKLREGDKLANRHGMKGVVTAILPDEQMPFFMGDQETHIPSPNGAQRVHLDIVINSLGILSRRNLGQIFESHLGWSAKARGQHERFRADSFDKRRATELISELRDSDLPEDGRVDVYDPQYDTPLKLRNKVVVGYHYIMKLDHRSSSKLSSRSGSLSGFGYSRREECTYYDAITSQPIRRRSLDNKQRLVGGQRLGEMEVWALEAHRAWQTLHELLTVRSDERLGRTRLRNRLARIGELQDNPEWSADLRNVRSSSLQALAVYAAGLGFTLDYVKDSSQKMHDLAGSEVRTHRTDEWQPVLPHVVTRDDVLNDQLDIKPLDVVGIRIRIPTKSEVTEYADASGARITECDTAAGAKFSAAGVFSEQVFGPTIDYTCGCGTTGVGLLHERCERCGVEYAPSKLRSYRMGYIELAVPLLNPALVRRVSAKMQMPSRDLALIIGGRAKLRPYVASSTEDDRPDPEIPQAETNDLDDQSDADGWTDMELEDDSVDSEPIPDMTGLHIRQYLFEYLFCYSETFRQSWKSHLPSWNKFGPGRRQRVEAALAIMEELSRECSTVLSSAKQFDSLVSRLKTTHQKGLMAGGKHWVDAVNGVLNSGLNGSKIIAEFLLSYFGDTSSFIHFLPVIPPSYRPTHRIDGKLILGELNEIYNKVIASNERLWKALGTEDGKVRASALWELWRCLLAVMNNENSVHPVRKGARALTSIGGILDGKEGMFRGHWLGKRLDYSARAVVVGTDISGNDRQFDECGVPIQVLVDILRPLIVGRLRRKINNAEGIAPDRTEIERALRAFGRRESPTWDSYIRESIKEVCKSNCVLINRQPTLQRSGLLAFRPVPVDVPVVQFNPILTKMFGMDFDGDTVAIYAAPGGAARTEIEQMRPHHHYLSLASIDTTLHTGLDIALGAYAAIAQDPGRNGNDPLEEHRERVAEFLGHLSKPPSKDELRGAITSHIERNLKDPEREANELQSLTDSCIMLSAATGLSPGVLDAPDVWISHRSSPIKKEDLALSVQNALVGNPGSDEVNRSWSDVLLSASAGKTEGIVQMLGGRIFEEDEQGPPGVTPSLIDGVPEDSYFWTTFIARENLLAKSVAPGKAGALTRTLIYAAQHLYVNQDDCGCARGLTLSDLGFEADEVNLAAERLLGRVLACQVVFSDREPCAAGSAVETIECAKQLAKAALVDGVHVEIRSPITCNSKAGICATCYGWDLAKRARVGIGEEVGIIAAQLIGEVGLQSAMDRKHEASAKSSVSEQIEALKRALNKPKFKCANDNESFGLLLKPLAMLRNKIDSRHVEVALRARICPDGQLLPLRKVPLDTSKSWLARAAYSDVLGQMARAAESSETAELDDIHGRVVLESRVRRG